MAFDASVVRCLSEELSKKLVGGRIDKIHQPEKDEIVVHVRTLSEHYKLVLSAGSAHPRAHFTEYTKKNPATAPLFCMLLRKHIGSGKITSVTQEGFERILKISIESYDELGDLTTKTLITEIMGRHSNIILTGADNRIIDSIKRVDLTVSSLRQILPGLEYQSPPRQNKIDLTDFSFDTNLDFSLPQKADKVILNAVAGISPLTAREIVYRTFGSTDINAQELNLNKQSSLKTEIIKFAQKIKGGDFSPCMITDINSGKIIDFSAFEIRQYESAAKITHYDNMSALLDEFYRLRDTRERMRQKSADLIKLLNNNIERASKKLVILQKTLNDAENKDKYKIYGDLLMTNMYQMTDNMKFIEVQNYYEEDMPYIKIQLDPQLSPSDNIQRFYKKYNKAKTAEIEAAKQIELSKANLDYLESSLAAVENSETEEDLNAIRAELIDEGYINRKPDPKRRKSAASKPLHFVSADGFDIYVGKNNTQNDYLTTKLANSSDIWFHTKQIHGSHTVIKLGVNKDVPKTTLIQTAQIAAYYSKGRNSSQVPVDYTTIKNVKKPNGAKPGMVIYDHYNTVYVTPKNPSEMN